ncbi:sensor histidine kinase NtrY-like [Oricola thermophila]|uniref:histidine kinase n=1 Tax=Oricola thermophila TaxID=2742145 RepID=A0A6N1VCA6_9HYPH|nr:PAS domain-containing sensor histidine kinase [Oricola thermophila]QKV18173.1 PAS domain-containing sensor histidine kinase [Oricola thermophila]
MSVMQSAKGAIDLGISDRTHGRRSQIGGIVVIVCALLTAGVSFAVLIGLTPIQPDSTVTLSAIAINGLFVFALMWLIGAELYRIYRARKAGKAASRLHVRIVGLFTIIAAVPALAIAIVASITLDLGLDRWFEIRTKTIVESSLQVAESYINENAINLRDATINMAFAVDSQRRLYSLDREGFRRFLTQQARGRGMLGAFVIRPDGTVVHSADIEVERPLPLPPEDALDAAKDGGPVLIPPGVTNLVGAIIMLREIPNAYLYTIRTVDADVLDAVQLMKENRDEYTGLEANRKNVQLAFAILYFGLTLVLIVSAIWTGLAVANRLVRPIRQLIGAAEEVSEGNLDVRVPVRASDGDVGYLGKTFNSMLGQLKGQRDEILRATELIDQRRRFSEAVLSGVSAGVMGIDDDGCITVSNGSAAAILGTGEQIAPGSKLLDVSPHVADVLSEVRDSGRPDARKQVNFLDRNGRERVLNVQVTMDREVDDGEGEEKGRGAQADDFEMPARHTHVITIDDISDLVEAQRATAWADVARRIAHEIKNPLTPIQLSAERLRRRYGKVVGEDREVFDQCTDTIIRQVGDIGRMVDEFSSFARMPKPVMERKDLRETLREATFLVEVSRSDFTFERDFGEDALICSFDDRLVGQAIGNIIKNASEAVEARQAADDSDEREEGHILVRAYRNENDEIAVDVVDNGKGLPRQNRAKLLEPYMTTREKGTGLGLAIVKKIMEDHGGRLELHDAPAEFHGGKGALVRLVFPAPASEVSGVGKEDPVKIISGGGDARSIAERTA